MGTELQEEQGKLLQGQENLLKGQEIIHNSLGKIAKIYDQSEITAE